jgi:hypothetical protein
MKEKDISIIPKGEYCYTIDRVDIKKGKIYTKNCPYYDYTEINDVSVPTCNYLGKMGVPDCSDEDFQKLISFYGNSDAVHEAMPLSLLFDSCKSCGENIE